MKRRGVKRRCNGEVWMEKVWSGAGGGAAPPQLRVPRSLEERVEREQTAARRLQLSAQRRAQRLCVGALGPREQVEGGAVSQQPLEGARQLQLHLQVRAGNKVCTEGVSRVCEQPRLRPAPAASSHLPNMAPS